MRTRWSIVLGIVLAFFATGLGVPAASATAPVALESGFVTDTSHTLSSADRAAAEKRLTELSEKSGLDLYVVFVDAFTSPDDAQQWADAVAEKAGLGARQYVLAIAVEQRNYYISADGGGPMTDSQLDQIEQDIRPLLRSGDWLGAVEKTADEFQGDGGAGILVFLGVLVAIAIVIVVVWLIVRARKAAARRKRGAMPEVADPNDPYSTITDDELAARAGSALVQADDALTSSREELGFAVAEFGEGSTAMFTDALDDAKERVSDAFAIKQQLDDEIPDTVDQRRAWHIQIIELCKEAADLLDGNADAFDELRKLEQDAPAALERVRTRRGELQTLLPTIAPALAALAGKYDQQALSTVADNAAQAQERAALADRSIDAAVTALTAGRNGEAAFAIRTAEQALAQGAQLAGAVTGLGSDLEAIEQQARALIADMQGDLVTASQLPDPGSLSPVVASTKQLLDQAAANLDGAARSPQRMLESLTAANTQIDGAIAQVREGVARAQRAQQMLQQQILQAQAQIRAAHEFIDTRRGSIGSTARTRLADAEAALDQAVALQATSPEQALPLASRALGSAQQAISAAQNDVSGFGGGGWGDPFGGGGNRGGGDLAGDILGGIIGGLIASGGSRGSHGGGWRSSGSGFRTGGFGGGFRSGGGGGGGGRGRSGGGRF
ncbi:TPM domain-containing protein [Microbacterium sp.]|uniref:TPM domain-containing protein n=1 Tax=Microbacterium sp. TaxID=51671 RepID=UPI00333E3F5C